MRHVKILVVLLALTLPFAGNLWAGCSQEGSVGGGTPYTELFYDVNFDGQCNLWHFSGTATLQHNGSDYYADFNSYPGAPSGTLYQNVTVPSNSTSQAMTINLSIIDNGAGSEKLWIRVFNTSGTLLETLGSIPAANNSGGRYDFNLGGNYAGQTLKISFSVPPGPGRGSSDFILTDAHFYEYY